MRSSSENAAGRARKVTLTRKKVKQSVISMLLTKADEQQTRMNVQRDLFEVQTRFGTVLVGEEKPTKNVEVLIKNKLGVAGIIISGNGQHRKLVSKAMLDHNTVVLPVTRSAPWFRDMQDHIIADPIPVPQTKAKLFVAVKFGTKEENLAYRKGLITRDLEQIRADAFKVMGGRFRSDCFIQYAMLLDSVAQLATLDGIPEDGYDIKSGSQEMILTPYGKMKIFLPTMMF